LFIVYTQYKLSNQSYCIVRLLKR